MNNIPTDLRYTASHEWARREGDELIIGITDHAQSLLGDLVFVELPEIDGQLNRNDDAVVVESVKAASDVYAPVAGTVIEVNHALTDSPQLVNQDCYGSGWLFKLRPDDIAEWDQLLDDDSYRQQIETDA